MFADQVKTKTDEPQAELSEMLSIGASTQFKPFLIQFRISFGSDERWHESIDDIVNAARESLAAQGITLPIVVTGSDVEIEIISAHGTD